MRPCICRNYLEKSSIFFLLLLKVYTILCGAPNTDVPCSAPTLSWGLLTFKLGMFIAIQCLSCRGFSLKCTLNQIQNICKFCKHLQSLFSHTLVFSSDLISLPTLGIYKFAVIIMRPVQNPEGLIHDPDRNLPMILND